MIPFNTGLKTARTVISGVQDPISRLNPAVQDMFYQQQITPESVAAFLKAQEKEKKESLVARIPSHQVLPDPRLFNILNN